jgi:hypothetical protein
MNPFAPAIDDIVVSYVKTCHWCDAEAPITYRYGTYNSDARQTFYSPPLCSVACHDEMYHDDRYTAWIG